VSDLTLARGPAEERERDRQRPGEDAPIALVPPGLARTILKDRTAVLGLVIVAFFVAFGLVAPLLAPHDPIVVTKSSLAAPSWDHPLGTDGLGRDLLSRLMFGARLSLGTAFVAAGLVTTLGVVFGTIAGYFRGATETLIMGVVDVILAFPGLVLALAIAGLLTPGILTVMLGLVTVWWVSYARIIRGLVVSIREREFVASARALGAGNLFIIRRHILPHVLSPVIVLVTLEMGSLILAISALSFLGLGAQPPTPEWGAMLNEGRVYFFSEPRVILVPGVAITLVVLGFNLLGDGIRDALDPKLR
jgi:peptide/nickel transport system permease protein